MEWDESYYNSNVNIDNSNNINSNIAINNNSVNSVSLQCTILDTNYDPLASFCCVILFSFGIIFALFGYRFYKATLFLTGFTFGLVIVYLICQEEDLLPSYGNVGISSLSGFLYGLICLLVSYVGYFTLGFHGGILLGLIALIFFPNIYTIWVSIIFLLGSGLFMAIANVCFPSLTMFVSSLVGAAAVTISFDYFVEKLKLAKWIWSHAKGSDISSQLKETENVEEFCWFSWLLLSIWPFLFFVGFFIQYFLTAKGFTIRSYPYKKNEPPRRRLTREERAMARQAKYRYLYQIRTAGGDILSQSYIQSFQKSQNLDTLSTKMSTLPPPDEENKDDD